MCEMCLSLLVFPVTACQIHPLKETPGHARDYSRILILIILWQFSSFKNKESSPRILARFQLPCMQSGCSSSAVDFGDICPSTVLFRTVFYNVA